MIDKEDEIKQIVIKEIQRFPSSFFQVMIKEESQVERVVGTLYFSNDKEKKFWESTLKLMNEKLQRRELSL